MEAKACPSRAPGDNEPPLSVACQATGLAECTVVQCLLEAKANVKETLNIGDRYTPLMLACHGRYVTGGRV